MITAVAVTSALLVGGAVLLSFKVSRDDRPLGVAVPPSRVDDPVVRRSVASFRTWTVALTLVAAAIAGVLGSRGHFEFAVEISLLLALALLVLFSAKRGPIVRAKQEHGWYADVPEVKRASLTDEQEPDVMPLKATMLFLLSLVPGLVLTAWAVAVWDTIPDRVATHFDGSMNADGWTDKGPGLIAMTLFPVGLGLIMWGTGWITQRAPARSAERSRAVRRKGTLGLAWLTLVMNVLLSWDFYVVLNEPTQRQLQVALWATLAGVFVMCGWLIISMSTAEMKAAEREYKDPSSRPRHDPDDDEHWKAGLFYYNPDDPAFVVDKRVGIGTTFNFGHRWGKVAAVALVAIVVVSVVLPFVL